MFYDKTIRKNTAIPYYIIYRETGGRGMVGIEEIVKIERIKEIEGMEGMEGIVKTGCRKLRAEGEGIATS